MKISLANGNVITINALDTKEYEFSMVHDYIEYHGKSFLKALAFVDDFERYLEYVSKNIALEYASSCIMISLPVPFSKEIELVKLAKKNMGATEELEIKIRKQRDTITELQARLGRLELEKINSGTTTFYLMYSEEKGFYFDVESFLAKPHANKNNLDLLFAMYNDVLGFSKHSGENIEAENCSDMDDLLEKIGTGECVMSRTLSLSYGSLFMNRFIIRKYIDIDFPNKICCNLNILGGENTIKNIFNGVYREDAQQENAPEQRYKSVILYSINLLNKYLDGASCPMIRYYIPNKEIKYERITPKNKDTSADLVRNLLIGDPDIRIDYQQINDVKYILIGDQ